jgi:ABC-type nitrate/sulfonate/bicarbonate transport system substrate-binding protein
MSLRENANRRGYTAAVGEEEGCAMRKTLVGLACAVAVTGVLALSEQAGAAELKAWRHGVIQPKGDAGFSWMVTRHDFAAKNGLKLDMVAFKNGAIAHKALLAGQVDSIESSPGAAILASAHGADLKIVGCDWTGVPQGIMVHDTIHTIKDLKGKTIAVASPGSLPDLVIRAFLEKYNMPVSEVRLANLGGDLDRYKALLAGIADAGVISAEFLSVAPKNVKMLAAAHEVLPNYVRLCLTMRGDTVKSRHDDATHFIAAEVEALHYAVAHRDDTIQLTHELIHDKPDDPRPAYAFDYSVKSHIVDADIPLPMKKFEWMQEQFVKASNLKKKTDLAKLMDPELRAEAMALAAK